MEHAGKEEDAARWGLSRGRIIWLRDPGEGGGGERAQGEITELGGERERERLCGTVQLLHTMRTAVVGTEAKRAH